MQCAFRHILPVIWSRNLRLREKVDGFLLLNIYFVPLFAVLAWILGAVLFLLQPLDWMKFLWMVVPLGMTLWLSFRRYNLLNPFTRGFAGLQNYQYLLTAPAL